MQKTTLCLILLAASCLPAAAQSAMRAWTDDTGRQVQAEFGGIQGDSVLLRLSPEKTVPFPLARLSPADQDFVKSQSATPTGAVTAQAPPPGALPEPPRIPIEKRVWPGNVVVPTRSVEIAVVSEKPAERKYVYRSEAFEFTSQAKLAGSVMKEVARTFEATRSLVEALPWGVVCRPPDGMPRFLAALYETREDYISAGGPEMSGGVYSSADNIFKIPFPSLGMEKRGQTYFKNDNYKNTTLIHEITHQMMDDYLGFLPTWVIEGTAEYTEMIPYNAGTFRADSHKTAMKDQISSWRDYDGNIGGLEAHMTMPRSIWDQECSTPEAMRLMYHRSHLLVYYFCHLDGDKKGTRFMRFMEAVHGNIQAKRAFFADPRVKRLEGGRYTYPRDLQRPEMGGEVVFKHLPLLLEERSYAKLASEIVEGYKSIGVKVRVQ